MNQSFIQSSNPSWSKEDPPFDRAMRPQLLKEFIGQESLVLRLSIFLQAASERKEALGHCLFFGPPGLGKTTLAGIVAKEMGSNLVVTSGPAVEKPSDLAGILTNLQEGDILFIDEIHRLNRAIEEYLYSAMEDFSLDLLIDSGPSSRSVQIKLNPFTLIGATTRSGLVSAPMRSRFGMSLRLEFYPPKTLAQILSRSANILKIHLEDTTLLAIADRSRGTPRVANHLLRWVRDVAQVEKQKNLDLSFISKALDQLAIDKEGLDEMDKKILTTIIDDHQGGPVGLNTLAIALSEDASTLCEVYEPYLTLKGFLRHTPRGREATERAYHHLEKELS